MPSDPVKGVAIEQTLRMLCEGRSVGHSHTNVRQGVFWSSARNPVEWILECAKMNSPWVWEVTSRPVVGDYKFHAKAEQWRLPGHKRFEAMLEIVEWTPFPVRHSARVRKIANRRDILRGESVPFAVVLGSLAADVRGRTSTAGFINLLASQNVNVLYKDGAWANEGEDFERVQELSDGLAAGYCAMKERPNLECYSLSLREQTLLLACLLLHWAGIEEFRRRKVMDHAGKAYGGKRLSSVVMGRLEDRGYINGTQRGPIRLADPEHVAEIFFELPSVARVSVSRFMSSGAAGLASPPQNSEKRHHLSAPHSPWEGLEGAVRNLRVEMQRLGIHTLTIKAKDGDDEEEEGSYSQE